LERFKDLPVRNMRVLDREFQAEMLVQAQVIQVGKVPHLGKSFEVLQTNEHAEACMILGMWRRWSIDKYPKVEVSEAGRFVAGGHTGDFAFAPDVLDGFGPWCGDLHKDVILEDLLGFAVSLVVDA